MYNENIVLLQSKSFNSIDLDDTEIAFKEVVVNLENKS